MEHLIYKSALVAEIEKRRKEWWFGSSIEAKYKKEECDDILSLINTLEVKEMDLNEEIKSYFKGFGKFASVGIDDCIDIAKHFFELGITASNKV